MKLIGILSAFLAIATTLATAEPRVLEVGTKPESVCRGFGGKLYVTMINGEEPGDGGINVIEGDKVSEFCRGMNAPKGLAYAGGFLVTADETTVWKVDKDGKVTEVAGKGDFPGEPEFLNDVAAASDGSSVYVTDMSHPKRMFDPDGERKFWPLDSAQHRALPHTGCVYRVTLDGEVSVAVPAGNKLMPGPNGVTTFGKGREEVLYMGDFFTGNIVTYDGKDFRLVADGMRGADAVAVVGNVIYVSSWPQGKVWKFDTASKERTVVADSFTTAADFFYDGKNKQLVVPDMLEGTLTFLPVE
jgi:sugar lactone lactonase YvrE